MRKSLTAICILTLIPALAWSQGRDRHTYSYVNEKGEVVYTDRPPPESAEQEKRVHNDEGIVVERIRGKKTAEEIAEEERMAKLEEARELERQKNQALLATYLSVEEIEMHRDRRVELFQAQARVTELYLRNLEKRLESLQTQASRFRPYSEDPDAEMIDPGLLDDLNETKDTIQRHEQNLRRYKRDENEMNARFEADIERFKRLKGADGEERESRAVVNSQAAGN